MFLSRRKFAVGFILLFLFMFTFWEWKMFLTAFNRNVYVKIIKQTVRIFACRYCSRQFDLFEELKSAIENWHNNRTTVQIFRTYIYVYAYGVKRQKRATFSLTKYNSKKRISTRLNVWTEKAREIFDRLPSTVVMSIQRDGESVSDFTVAWN